MLKKNIMPPIPTPLVTLTKAKKTRRQLRKASQGYKQRSIRRINELHSPTTRRGTKLPRTVELSAALNDEKASTQSMLSVKAELELALNSQVYVLISGRQIYKIARGHSLTTRAEIPIEDLLV